MLKKASTPKRRRSLGTRSERRVQEILRAARDVFAEKGFEKTTASEIAQRLGTSEATIFTYFRSKRELCMEVLRVWYYGISAELERGVSLVSGFRNQLHFVIRKHLKHLIEEGTGICALILHEGRNVDQEFTDLIIDIKRRYTAPLMAALSAAQKSGEIRADLPLRLMRDMVYGSMEHMLWSHIHSSPLLDVNLTASQLSDMLWRAFMTPDRPIEALAQFRAEVADALHKFESGELGCK
jgi:AcrR family transcriptional regulator